MTYKEAFDKITTAYINDYLDPYNSSRCFIGNLLGSCMWSYWRKFYPNGKSEVSDYLTADAAFLPYEQQKEYEEFPQKCEYDIEDIVNMENNFISIIERNNPYNHREYYIRRLKIDENLLYEAMVSTLDMLKQIHIKRGEEVDDIILNKRELVTV